MHVRKVGEGEDAGRMANHVEMTYTCNMHMHEKWEREKMQQAYVEEAGACIC